MTFRVLDLFCGAGGAAMGYHQAWPDAEIVGVDLHPQPRYPFTFVQGDATTYPLDGFDFVHASPPCQEHTSSKHRGANPAQHNTGWMLEHTMTRLQEWGGTWVVENVPGAPMAADFLLCGSMFGLRVQRHRLFVTNPKPLALVHPCRHVGLLPFEHKAERAYADAMGCTWMNKTEARQAIPPAYTRFIAEQLRPVERAA